MIGKLRKTNRKIKAAAKRVANDEPGAVKGLIRLAQEREALKAEYRASLQKDAEAALAEITRLAEEINPEAYQK